MVLRYSSVNANGLRITGLEEKLGPYWRNHLAEGLDPLSNCRTWCCVLIPFLR